MARIANKKSYAPEGYFEFTGHMKSRGELFKWEKWFDKVGIKSQVMETDNGTFILCREGVEAWEGNNPYKLKVRATQR